MFTLLNLQVSAFRDFAFLVLPAGKLAVFLSVLKHTPFQVCFFKIFVCFYLLFGCIQSSLQHVGSFFIASGGSFIVASRLSSCAAWAQ